MKRLIEWLRKRQRKKPPRLPENPYRPIYSKPRRFEQLFPKPPKK